GQGAERGHEDPPIRCLHDSECHPLWTQRPWVGQVRRGRMARSEPGQGPDHLAGGPPERPSRACRAAHTCIGVTVTLNETPGAEKPNRSVVESLALAAGPTGENSLGSHGAPGGGAAPPPRSAEPPPRPRST